MPLHFQVVAEDVADVNKEVEFELEGEEVLDDNKELGAEKEVLPYLR